MSGNVREWVWDRYDYYSSSSSVDPTGPSRGSFRVERGGSWNTNAQDIRASNRNVIEPRSRNINLGFRLVRTMNDGYAPLRLED